MKLALDHITAGVSSIILLAFILLYLLATASLRNHSHIDTLAQNLEIKVPVLVIPGTMSHHDLNTQLLAGEASFLFLPTTLNTRVDTDIFAHHFFLSNTDYQLEMNLFNQLWLGQFVMQGKSFIQHRIKDTELRSIKIYKKPILLHGHQYQFMPLVGEAITVNNVHHPLHLMYLNPAYLQIIE